MSVSLNFRRASYSQETELFIIGLITISHEDLTDDILLSTDPTERITTPDSDIIYGTISRGNTYIFLPIKIKLPSDTDEGPGNFVLEMDNIHQDMVEALRSISTPPSFKLELVLNNDLDTVEVSWPEFLLTGIKYNDLTISGTLTLEMLEREPFPSGSFTPTNFPGLF